MKQVAVLYATREGHTGRIADYIAADLRRLGCEPVICNLRDEGAGSILEKADAAIVAGSVHAGRHEAELVDFVKTHRAELESKPAAFLSVTLSETGAEDAARAPEERARFAADVQTVIDGFFAETGWHPQRVKPVAGALR
jgi:menaquinone-dependent protoporphyrinogen oxidase